MHHVGGLQPHIEGVEQALHASARGRIRAGRVGRRLRAHHAGRQEHAAGIIHLADQQDADAVAPLYILGHEPLPHAPEPVVANPLLGVERHVPFAL
jgi:hypothetical protein